MLGCAGLFGGLVAVCVQWDNDFARADGLAQVLLVAGAGVVVIEDRITVHAHGRSVADSRVTAWRLADGARVAHVAGERDLHVLGPAGDLLWCSSAAMPVHVRSADTLAIVRDEHDLLAASGLTLARLGADAGRGGNPVFDPTTGGVHAFASDGRGYLIAADGAVTESPRSATGHVHRTSSKSFSLKTPAAQARWLAAVPEDVRLRMTEALVSAERAVLVFGPSPTHLVGSGSEARIAGGGEGYRVIALDPSTGRITWQQKL